MHYVMSDLHGRYDLYKKMLEAIRLSDEDVLYILGDFLDRGEEGFRILFDVSERSNIVALRGNHDHSAYNMLKPMGDLVYLYDFYDIDFAYVYPHTSWDKISRMNHALYVWRLNGGETTYEEYRALTDDERERALQLLSGLGTYAEVSVGGRDFVLCHAGIAGYVEGKPLAQYSALELCNVREDYSVRKFAEDNKYLVTGHTPTVRIEGGTEGRIYKGNGHIAVDCGAVFGYGLGCLCLETMEEFYVV